MTKSNAGRPAWILTDEHRAIIKQAAANGVTQADIARLVGLSPGGFIEKKKQIPELNDLIKNAHAVSHDMAAGFLRNIWSNPDHPKHLAALIFYLKTRHGWKDQTEVEVKQLPDKLVFTKATDIKKEDE